MPIEPPYPTPGRRTKSPLWAPYAKYELSRSISKSSHQIQPGRGALHSDVSFLVGHTVITAVPRPPPLVATICAVPGASPVTIPVSEIAAISGFKLVQEISRRLTGRPFSSLGDAMSC